MAATFSTERYQRQLVLDNFGPAAQEKLFNTSVLIVGAGGLGCPALSYLAAAGVGRIGIIDDDIIALHNLHRQPLYTVADVGALKSVTARSALQRLNPEIDIEAITERLTENNALHIFENFDFIVDGTDNFTTRYLINDACVLLGKPLIYGAVSQYEGQVAIFNVSENEEPAVNYRDLFPEPPLPGTIQNCAEAGVLGVLPGLVGTMMATELIKLITGIGKALINSLMTIDILNNNFLEIELTANPGTRKLIPVNANAFMQTRYEVLCSANPYAIDVAGFNELIGGNETAVVDVREIHEMPEFNPSETIRLPLAELADNLPDFARGNIVFVCQSGIRSVKAAELLADFRKSKTGIYSLENGVIGWLKFKNEKTNV